MNPEQFDIIDSLQRNLHFQSAAEHLEEHIDDAIKNNDLWFLNAYSQFHWYAALPEFSSQLDTFLENAVNHASNKDFLHTALFQHARLHHALGHQDEVISITQRLLDSSPNHYDALYLYITNDGDISQLSLYKNYKKQWRQRDKGNHFTKLGFCLYEIKERLNDKTTEKQLLEANAYINRQIQKQPPLKFTPIPADEYITSQSSSTTKPIFITGLPRSGSTLIEQLLARYEDVRALGECNYLKASAACAGIDLFYGEPRASRQQEYTLIRHAYLNQITGRGYTEPYVVDKSLNNLFQIEHILNLFPESPIIISYRNPVKNALSIFRKMFEGDYRYAYDIELLCQHVTQTTNYINQCKEKYKNQKNLTFIDFENFVKNPDNADRLCTDILGAPITSTYKSIQSQNTSVILTASATKARNPVSDKQVHKNLLLPGISRNIGKRLKASLLR